MSDSEMPEDVMRIFENTVREIEKAEQHPVKRLMYLKTIAHLMNGFADEWEGKLKEYYYPTETLAPDLTTNR